MMRELQYLWRLARSVFGSQKSPGKLRAAAVVPALVLSLLILAGALRSPVVAHGIGLGRPVSRIDAMLERTREVSGSLATVETVYRSDVEPIERALSYYRRDTRLVRRVATALVREAQRAQLDPEVLLAVLLVENPMLDPSARSSVGARGLMQVMPLHKGQWKACPGDLEGIESNICYGAQIFRSNLRATGGDMERALLRYNGCVNSTNTPNCQMYPYHVYARAGRAALQANQRAAGGS